MSQKSATVAVVSPFSATVADFCDSLTFLRQCGQGFRLVLKRLPQQEQEEQEVDMRSVPDLKANERSLTNHREYIFRAV